MTKGIRVLRTQWNTINDISVWEKNGQTFIAVARREDILLSTDGGTTFDQILQLSDVSPGVNPGWVNDPAPLTFAGFIAGYENRVFVGLDGGGFRRSGGFYEIELQEIGNNVASVNDITGNRRTDGFWARSNRATVVDNVTDSGAFLLVPTRGCGMLRYKVGSGNAPAPEMDVISGGQSVNVLSEVDYGQTTVGNPISIVYDIENNGSQNLVLSESPPVELIGTGASQFEITQQPTSPVTPGNSTSFTIEFDPATVTGIDTASVVILNNDVSESEYIYNVKGVSAYPPFAGASDDFETGDFAGGTGWADVEWDDIINNGQRPVINSANGPTYDGSYHAEVRRQQKIIRGIDLTGAINPVLKFAWKSVAWNDSTDGAVIEVNDGSGYIPLLTLTQSDSSSVYVPESISLSGLGLTFTSYVRIRFRGTGNGFGDYFYVDAVNVYEQ
jgi:hypothetical protein